MRECVSAVFGAALGRMNPRRLQFCWELLGLDFMLDAAGQVGLGSIWAQYGFWGLWRTTAQGRQLCDWVSVRVEGAGMAVGRLGGHAPF